MEIGSGAASVSDQVEQLKEACSTDNGIGVVGVR
jgi:hypothetical protein